MDDPETSSFTVTSQFRLQAGTALDRESRNHIVAAMFGIRANLCGPSLPGRPELRDIGWTKRTGGGVVRR